MGQEIASNPNKKRFYTLWFFFATALLSSCSYIFYPAECDLSLPGGFQKQTGLDPIIEETSGLLYLEGNVRTFNDSGGEAALFLSWARFSVKV